MRIRQGYRCFLGIRPDPPWYPLFQQICEGLGLPCRLDRLHLTLCVVAESLERDPFVARRLRRALRDAELHSFAVSLSSVRAAPNGATAYPSGRQDEIQDFYRMLIRLLRAAGIEPLHRKSGLHPHVTLSYRACRTALLPVAIQWFPLELMLIESEVGLTKHTVLERWSLHPPRQPLLPFGDVRIDGLSATG
jgi:2'-5' RNA ligase